VLSVANIRAASIVDFFRIRLIFEVEFSIIPNKLNTDYIKTG